MPGIRIQNPVGTGWLYSLDQQSWQQQPVFSKQANGQPFEAGITYPVYFKNETLNRAGFDSIIFGQADNEAARLSRLLRSLSDADYRYICGRLSLVGCAGSGGGTVVTPKFSFVHYQTAKKPSEQTYPYVLGDGTYAGTFDTIDDQSYGWWALKRGVGAVGVDMKWRRRGTADALQNAGLNLPANFERQDVIDAPGINTPGAVLCGRRANIPDAFRTGYEIEVHVFVAGTNVELKDSPRYLNLATTVAPIPNDYRINGDNSVDEGGMAKQQVLQQHWTDNSWHDVPAQNWAVDPAPVGIGVPNGLFKADANSVSETRFFTISCQPVGSSLVLTKKMQVVDTGCTRPGGLTTFTGTYATAPKNAGATLFSSLSDANQRMGYYYDHPSDFNVAQFPFQAANLNVGTDVYNRADVNTCERVSDDIIYVSDSSGGNTVKRAIRIQNGKIADGQNSTYQTPAPIPDTSWSTMNDPLDASVPTYYQANGSVWSYGGGNACMNPAGLTYASGSLVLDVQAERILTLVTPGGNAGQPLIGVGLCYAKAPVSAQGNIPGGYNLLLTMLNGVPSVVFLFDYKAFGPSYAYAWEPGQSYYMALRYSRRDKRLTGKVWRAIDSEPVEWSYVWNDVEDREGYAALIGGSDYMGAKNGACFSHLWVKSPDLAPTLTDVAQGKAVLAPYDPGLGDAWKPSNVTDNDKFTNYTTACILLDTVTNVVIDLNGLARPQQIGLTPRQDFPGAMPVDYSVDGSLDGQNWFVLVAVIGQARGKAETILNVNPENGSYRQVRYVRLHVTRNGRAEESDCIRVQLAGFRVLAPQLEALPADQQSTILEIAQAFVGINNSRDLFYFVKNGSTTEPPTSGFTNLQTNYPNDLAGNHSFSRLMANDQYPNPDWYSILNQARAAGFPWIVWVSDGDPGQTVRMRFKGRNTETAYRTIDFVGPADGTIQNLTNIFPIS